MDHSGQIAQLLMWNDIAQAFWAVFFLATCGGVWFAVFKLIQVLKKVEAALDPLAGKGLEVMDNVDQTLVTLRGKAEAMMDAGEKAVESVAAKVDTTSSLVEGAVARPAISLSSIMAGVNRGFETWRQFIPDTRKNGIVPGVEGETVVGVPAEGSSATEL